MLSKEQQIEYDMMANPPEWPLWPYLPIKKPIKGQSWPDLGFMIAHQGPKVYHASLDAVFTAKSLEFDDVSQIKFSSIEDIVKDGWIVD